MKRILLVVLGLSLLIPLSGAAGQPVIEEQKGKDSYSLGYQFGSNLRRQGVEIDPDLLISALRSGLDGRSPAMTSKDMTDTLQELQKKIMILATTRVEEAAAANLEKGKAFLELNKTKEGVTTLPSGLQYKVEREGTGRVPNAADHVAVHYRGQFIDGTEFDNTYKRGEPSIIPVEGTIKAWTEALQLMKTGSKWQLFVPPALAYGKRRFGRILPNSVLIFEIELLSIEKGGPAAPHDLNPGKEGDAISDSS